MTLKVSLAQVANAAQARLEAEGLVVRADAWRIEREPVKLFFRVVRTLEDGPEFIRSASGKVSIFRTYKAAQRAVRFAEAREAE